MNRSVVKKNPDRRPKGNEARRNLKEAALGLLNTAAPHEIRIKNVTDAAGMTIGNFYHYFQGLDDLLNESMEDFVREFKAIEKIETGVKPGDWFARINAHFKFMADSYERSPGLIRCMFSYASDEYRFRELWRRAYADQVKLFTDKFIVLFPDHALSTEQIKMIVHGLIGVGNEVLKEYYLERNSDLADLDMTTDEIAEWLAVIFYRGLFGRNPAPEKLKYSEKILALKWRNL